MRVLLFSQDDAFRFLVRQTFRKLNVRDVLSTSVSADATPFMGQVPDIGLLDLDGDVAAALAFLERVRAADADMPVLVVARSGERAGLDHALDLGIEGVVPKLVSGHELAHRVAETLKKPQRMPPPAAAKPKAAIKLAPRPQAVATQLPSPPPGAVAALPGRDDSATQKQELAALTARLGQHIGGTGGGTRSGGSLAGSDAQTRGRLGGGRLADDDVLPSKPAAGRLGDDDLAPAKPAGGPLETLAESAPAALKLKPKAKDDAARRKEEEAKSRWHEALAELGHKSRTGRDVAALDVTAIVAAHLEWLASKGTAGKRASLHGMDLAGADLARTVLANATFREADLSDSCLAESRLDGADFRYAKLGAADLTGANLGVAQLRHADLRLANLQGACLRGADLSGARLRGARLAGADFSGATLVGSDLAEADLSQVDNLTQGQLDKANCDMKTKLPPGVFRPRPKDEA